MCWERLSGDNRGNGDGKEWNGSGKNLSLVLKVPRQHIYDWFSAGMIIEIIRARWDGTRRGKNLLTSH